MSTPIYVGVYGTSNTGKTMLIENLITYFHQKKKQCATIKCTDKPLSIDTEGKDTFRHAQAGAHLTVFSSAVETTYLVKSPMKFSNIKQHLESLVEVDIVFVEGATDPSVPKISLGDCPKRENTIFEYKNNFSTLVDFLEQLIIRRS